MHLKHITMHRKQFPSAFPKCKSVYVWSEVEKSVAELIMRCAQLRSRFASKHMQ